MTDSDGAGWERTSTAAGGPAPGGAAHVTPGSGRTWVVPGYTELRLLGRGGFGEVILATQDASGTPVAIKYLHQDLLGNPEHTAMFRAEATRLSQVDDPNVVRLYEYVAGPAGAAIVMEFVDGVTLQKMLEHHGKTTPESALVVLYGSLLGLAAAHAKGVVHRDYKPANVLVNGQGASKLTDFGIAALAGDRPVPTGTLRYMPPEQFEDAQASPAADVYAATVTFYECLTGHVPFDGRTAQELYDKHKSVPVPLDEVPEPLRPIIARGMAKDPARRPADAKRLAAELREAATDSYGEDWATRGLSYLAEAAVALLALLWPSGSAPAAQGISVTHTPLSEPANEPSSSAGHAGAGHPQAGHNLSGQPQPSHAQLNQNPASHTQLHQNQHELSQAAEHLRHLGHVLHEEHLTHVRDVLHGQHEKHAEHLTHLRNLLREDGGDNGGEHGGQSAGRRMLRRVRMHPVAAAVTGVAAVVVITVVAYFASAGGGTPPPTGLPSGGGGAALAGAPTTGSPGGAPASGSGLPSYCDDWGNTVIGQVAVPFTAASVAADLKQEIATCTGHVVSVSCVVIGSVAIQVDYTCSIPAGETPGTKMQPTSEIFVATANGNWTWAGVP